jgi:hypothetical protein
LSASTASFALNCGEWFLLFDILNHPLFALRTFIMDGSLRNSKFVSRNPQPVFLGLVESIVVGRDKVTVRFKDGTEAEV